MEVVPPDFLFFFFVPQRRGFRSRRAGRIWGGFSRGGDVGRTEDHSEFNARVPIRCFHQSWFWYISDTLEAHGLLVTRLGDSGTQWLCTGGSAKHTQNCVTFGDILTYCTQARSRGTDCLLKLKASIRTKSIPCNIKPKLATLLASGGLLFLQ